jgi:hypothetical protein
LIADHGQKGKLKELIVNIDATVRNQAELRLVSSRYVLLAVDREYAFLPTTIAPI